MSHGRPRLQQELIHAALQHQVFHNVPFKRPTFSCTRHHPDRRRSSNDASQLMPSAAGRIQSRFARASGLRHVRVVGKCPERCSRQPPFEAHGVELGLQTFPPPGALRLTHSRHPSARSTSTSSCAETTGQDRHRAALIRTQPLINAETAGLHGTTRDCRRRRGVRSVAWRGSLRLSPSRRRWNSRPQRCHLPVTPLRVPSGAARACSPDTTRTAVLFALVCRTRHGRLLGRRRGLLWSRQHERLGQPGVVRCELNDFGDRERGTE